MNHNNPIIFDPADSEFESPKFHEGHDHGHHNGHGWGHGGFDHPPIIPEPSTWALLLVGLLFMVLTWKRRSIFSARKAKVNYNDIL